MAIFRGVCEVVVDTILDKWSRWKNKNEIKGIIQVGVVKQSQKTLWLTTSRKSIPINLKHHTVGIRSQALTRWGPPSYKLIYEWE